MHRITPTASPSWIEVPVRRMPIAFLCLWLVSLPNVLATPLNAPNQSDAPITPLSGIAHVAIRVPDLARSRAFYEKLGFDEAFAIDKGGTPTEAFLKVNDRQFIEIYPQRETSQAIGFQHVCFETANIEALNHDYMERGLAPTAVRKAGAGNLLFTMHGPEGQTIEYTQYMPGSKHTNDIGLHLGTNRISKQVVGLAIAMQDVAAAESFYENKLGFQPAAHPLEPGSTALQVPGVPGAQLAFISSSSTSSFRLLFAVPNLSRTAAQLKTLQLPITRHKYELSIVDPDGNTIVFIKVKP